MNQKTDMPARTWVNRLPRIAQPYARLMRLDRPVGIWMTLFPAWWALTLAAPCYPDLRLMLLFFAGAVLMRGAGCTLNDMMDRDLDAQVERTRTRPIPAGEVTFLQAGIFLVAQLVLALFVLLQLNGLTICLGVAALLLVGPYPLMKRFTWWPQAWLGLAFGWGALMGWSAATGTLAPPAFLILAATVFWTLGYDTIYAHQDAADDARMGMKSSALRLGARSPSFVGGFFALAGTFVLLAGMMAGLGWQWPFLLLPAFALFVVQLWRWDMTNPADCLRRFKLNIEVGWLVLAAIVVGKVL